MALNFRPDEIMATARRDGKVATEGLARLCADACTEIVQP